MIDTTSNDHKRGSQVMAWVLCLLFAAAAAVGWYEYRDAQAETQNLARISEAQINDLEENLRQLQQSNEQLQSELDAERQARQQEVNRLSATSAELEAELQQRLAQQASLNRQVSEASEEKRQLANRLDEAQHRRQQLLEQIAEVSGDVEAKEAKLAAADRDILELSQQLERTLLQQDVLEAKIAEIRGDVEAKEARLAAADRDIHKLSEQLERTLSQQDVLEAKIVELNEQQRREAEQFASLKQNLEQELSESQVRITQLKNRMTVIDLTSEVLFDSGSARITPTGKKLLDVIAASLNAYPERAISIEGHTDNVPIGQNSSFGSNWELSTARAQAAVDYLQQHAQVAPGRLQVVGHGEHHPVASNDTAEGRRLNRRIEIRLLPIAEASI